MGSSVRRFPGASTMAGVDVIRIVGGARLNGEVTVGGAKNSALKLMAAALLAPGGHARVAHPGGDAIGSRGLDMHVGGLARMGAEISGEHGYVIASAPRGLHGATIWLDFPSVGATENLLMAAVLAHGVTEIDNAAREPEIVDLCDMLTEMGARISGAGTSQLVIEGVSELRPVRHRTA